MAAEVEISTPPTVANEDVESRRYSTENEATPLLSDPSVEETSAKAKVTWSPTSLGPGFIWIQAGTSPLHPTSKSQT